MFCKTKNDYWLKLSALHFVHFPTVSSISRVALNALLCFFLVLLSHARIVGSFIHPLKTPHLLRQRCFTLSWNWRKVIAPSWSFQSTRWICKKCLPHCLYSCHRNSCLWLKSGSCLLGSMFWLRMFDCLFGGCHLLPCSPNAHDSRSSSRISNSSSGCSAGICQKGGNCSCQERPMATPVYTKRCVKKGLLGFIGDKMKKVTQVTWTFLQYPNIFRDKSAWFRLKWILHVSPTCFNM